MSVVRRFHRAAYVADSTTRCGISNEDTPVVASSRRPELGRSLAQRSRGIAIMLLVMDRTSRTREYVYERPISRRTDHGLCSCPVTDHEYPPPWLRRSTTSGYVLPGTSDGWATPSVPMVPYITRPCESIPVGPARLRLKKPKSDRTREYKASTPPMRFHGRRWSTAIDARCVCGIRRLRSVAVNEDT